MAKTAKRLGGYYILPTPTATANRLGGDGGGGGYFYNRRLAVILFIIDGFNFSKRDFNNF
jgi:hypothetical protein